MKSVVKVFQVLETLCTDDAMGLSELSDKLNVHRTSAYRFLSVLARMGYVEKDELTKKYHPSLKVFQLGVSARNRKFSLHLVRPYMEELAKFCHETVNLALFIQDRAVVIDRIESSETLKTDLGIGTTLPAYCTALGKVFLANLSEEDLGKYLQKQKLTPYTKRTITFPEPLKAHLLCVRKNGFSIDDREFGEGIRCIASPIMASCGAVVAAISLSGPSSRLTMARLKSMKQPLVSLSSEIGLKIEQRGFN